MTIQEFFYRYRDIGLQNCNIGIEYNDDFEHTDLYPYKNIILTGLPSDSDMMTDIIMGIFARVKSGTSLYIGECPEDFIGLLEQKYQGNDDIHRRCGMVIQHIYDVGYMISLAKCSPLFRVNNYTLDEYDRLSQEYIVVGMAKGEKHYIKDWVEYHLHIGFDRIYLYDNNTDPNETYDELLSEYIDDGRVELINFRDKVGMQNSSYNASYYLFPFKWMAVIDIDEFIWFKETYKYNNIKDFLQNICKDQDRFGVMLQWHCYSSSGDDRPSDKPAWEANTELLSYNVRKNCRPEYIHDWCKSIYKSGYALEMNEHFGWELDSRPDNQGIYVKENDYRDNPITKDQLIYITEDEFNAQGVYIKHFLLRNIDDFYFRKYLRGHAGGDFTPGDDGWAFWQWRQNLNYFTDILTTLSEKEQIYLKKHGMKMNYTFHPDVVVNWYMLKDNRYINYVVNQIITDRLLSISNCFVNQITIANADNPLETDDYMEEVMKSRYDLDFLSRYYINNCYFDVTMGGEKNIIRRDIQDPIIINIGIPLKFATQPVSIDEQKQYGDLLWKVFSPDRVKQYLRAALDHELTTIPAFAIEDNRPDCMGYRGSLERILKDNNLEIPDHALLSNTMIMPYSQYLKLCGFQNDFVNTFGWWYNKDICDNARGNYNTPYHAYECSVMSIMDNVQFVEP